MDSIYHFKWSGEHISLNEWYSAKHWTVRYDKKAHWSSVFKPLIEAQKLPKIGTYKIELIYNSRLDPTNTITMIKLFEDTLKDLGYIIDDNKHYCKEVKITPDFDKKNKEYEIILNVIK